MANRTDSQADTIHGTNPQYLVDRIIRVKIYNDAYWKEFCFGLTTESFIDRAAEIDYVGGTYGGRRRPAKFLCLFLKLLQIQPEEDVIMEYIRQADFKYLRALGAAYLRISSRPMKVYQTLEPLYADYRKLRYRNIQGKLSLIHMDEYIDWLLREETVCDITMPRLPKRDILEETMSLPPRTSILEDDLDDLEELETAQAAKEAAAKEAAAKEVAALRAAAGIVPPEAAEPAAGEPAGAAKEAKPPVPAFRDSPSPARKRSPARREASPRRESRRSRSPRRATRDRSASGGEKEKEKRQKAKEQERREKEKERGKEERGKEEKKKEKKEKDKAKAPKGKDKDKDKAKSSGGGKEKDGLSADAWDAIRKEMGLKPLKR